MFLYNASHLRQEAFNEQLLGYATDMGDTDVDPAFKDLKTN